MSRTTTLVKAYIFITTDIKRLKKTLEQLRALKISVEAITGPYDLIAIVETESIDSLGQLVAQEILSIEGVDRTLTCMVLKL